MLHAGGQGSLGRVTFGQSPEWRSGPGGRRREGRGLEAEEWKVGPAWGVGPGLQAGVGEERGPALAPARAGGWCPPSDDRRVAEGGAGLLSGQRTEDTAPRVCLERGSRVGTRGGHRAVGLPVPALLLLLFN